MVRADKFPPGPDGENGIAVVADYVHSLGLKFGIYVTPGISDQAVAKNTPILGTHYTADEIATKARQNNYNCGGMTGINYAKPGAQAYVNSIVDEFARWGVDYIKLDGITDHNTADIAGLVERDPAARAARCSWTLPRAVTPSRSARRWTSTPPSGSTPPTSRTTAARG